jgi:PAS domain S-box-containing protein
MALEREANSSLQGNPAFRSAAKSIQEIGETKLLLEAFEMFTHASSSLESAFNELQMRAQRLTEELEAKNQELEISLREKEEAQNYLKTILERLPCGVFVLDQEGELSLCNPMAAEVLGKHKGKAQRPKGSQPFISSGLRSDFAESVSSGRSGEVEIPFVSGNRKRVLATSGAPLTDAAGSRVGTLHIIRDITEMKALQEKSKRTERLSAMGEMAVELAHEIRNPLGSVELFASLLAKELAGDPKRWADNIRMGIRSLNNIVSNMLHFANPLSARLEELNLHEVVQETLAFTDAITEQREVRVNKLLEAGDPFFNGDRELLKQMMLNLILNAMKAMPAKGSLTIRTRNVGERKSRGRSLELQVQDTGIGIPPENLNHIFDPFFTTNKNGTGLGLSVVHQIVERHAGTIRVESELNHGTTFTITFASGKSVVRPEKD